MRSSVGLLALCLLSCGLDPGVTAEEICEDVITSVAQQTAHCVGDLDLANARAALMDTRYRCASEALVTAGGSPVHGCSNAIGKLSCDQVGAYGDEIDRWLEASPICAQVLVEVAQ